MKASTILWSVFVLVCNASVKADVFVPPPGSAVPQEQHPIYLFSKEKLDDLRKRAESGQARDMYLMGVTYATGVPAAGQLKDEEKALEWFRKAAAHGQEDALFEMALRHLHAAGVKKDVKTAKDLLSKASEKNHLRAQILLAELYMDGEEPEFQKAANLLRRANQMNASPKILYLLAQCCLQQYEAIDATEKEGDTLMLKAAMGGWPDAQFTRGLMCEFDRIPNAGAKEAAEWYVKAASQGHAEAQYRLGLLYQNGNGVKADDEMAVRYYLAAAEGGNAEAQYELGLRYASGIGIYKDDHSSVKWLKKATAQNHPEAMNNLACLYLNGRNVPMDKAQAITFFQKAAELGCAKAMHNLGACYEKGDGVQINREEALKWYDKAVENGFTNAEDAAKKLRNKQ